MFEIRKVSDYIPKEFDYKNAQFKCLFHKI